MVSGAAFEVTEPRSGESPVVVEVPHASVTLDPESLAFTIAPARCIARDADLYVDRLCELVPSEGATLLCASLSRYVVDLNRAPDEYDEEAAEGGGPTPWPRGLVWRLSTDGDPVLARRLPRAELERRLEHVYRPYHATLAKLLERKRARFGRSVLICAHSMPTRRRAGDAAPARADIVPGTRGRTTAAGALIDLVDQHARAHGYSVQHDVPYRGGYATGHYGTPSTGSHAVQIEIARRLYMDEATFRIDPQGFRGVQEFARTLAARLAHANLPMPDRGGAERA